MTNIKISALFTNAILSYYQNKKSIAKPIFDLLITHQNEKLVPLETYNEVCDWIESKLGIASLKLIGLEIGDLLYETLLNNGGVSQQSDPEDVIEAFVKLNEELIENSDKPSWEIIEIAHKHLVIRMVQNFNANIQLGVLKGLLEKTVPFISVKFDQKGDGIKTFNEYLLTWFTH